MGYAILLKIALIAKRVCIVAMNIAGGKANFKKY
jgi:hypothetical protein